MGSRVASHRGPLWLPSPAPWPGQRECRVCEQGALHRGIRPVPRRGGPESLVRGSGHQEGAGSHQRTSSGPHPARSHGGSCTGAPYCCGCSRGSSRRCWPHSCSQSPSRSLRPDPPPGTWDRVCGDTPVTWCGPSQHSSQPGGPRPTLLGQWQHGTPGVVGSGNLALLATPPALLANPQLSAEASWQPIPARLVRFRPQAPPLSTHCSTAGRQLPVHSLCGTHT